MKKKILVIMICTLLITTLASFTVIADDCEKKPSTHHKKNNSPPLAPEIEIPKKVKSDSWLYLKALSTDPDNDLIYYKYDIFGYESDWIGPYHSGEKYSKMLKIGHEIGNYELGVKSKDCKNAESKWTYISFDVVKTKSAYANFVNLLQSRFSLFTLLNFLVQI
jgi:hypothetical protein